MMIIDHLACAESFCRALAPQDLGETPIYIVPQTFLPASYFSGQHHYGFTTPALDLYVCRHIPDYRGRGPCMVINDTGIAEDYEPEDWEFVVNRIALHELGHILDRPATFECRQDASAAKIMFESLIVANQTWRPNDAELPKYFGHEHAYIRISLHLCHRASLLGVDIRPPAVCAGRTYGLSHASEYQDALGDEPDRCVNLAFGDIMAVDPPQEFSLLWERDVVSYQNRSVLLKGSSE